MLSRVRLISVAAVVMAVGAAPGPAVAAERAGSTDIPSTVADAYSRTYNVSVDVARTRLRVQYRGLDLENELRRALGEGFGGLAFGNDAAGYQVFVTREQDRPEVERLLAERNLSATSEVVGVRSTWHELEAGRDSVVAKLSHLIADREAQVGLSAVDNAVRVLIPNTLANSRYELVRNVAERASVNVVIEKANPSEFKVVPRACAYPNCSQPMRGAVAIGFSNSYWCSAGFYAWAGSQRYLVTAGHCLANTSLQWQAWDPYVNPWIFNTGAWSNRYYNINGDGAVIQLTGSHWDPQPWTPRVAAWTVSEDWIINWRDYAVQGWFNCRFGRSSQVSCGTVTSTGATITYSDGTTVGNMATSTGCATGGDSGGSVVVDHGAVGVTSASTGSCPNPNATVVFTQVRDIEYAMGVTVAHTP